MKTLKVNNKVDFYKYILLSRANSGCKAHIQEIPDVTINDFLSRHYNTDAFIYLANKIDFSETKEQKRKQVDQEKQYTVIEFTWLKSVFNPRKLKRFKQMLQVALIITTIGIIAGTIAAFTDVASHKVSEETALIDRIDRLIHAVELDWGR